MRVTTFLLAGLFCVSWAGVSAANSSGRLVVRRVTGPTATTNAPSTQRAGALEESNAILAKRLEHWRSFRHHLSAPGVDWSVRANRRVGWRAPARPIRNPHEREPLTAGRSAARAGAAATALDPPDTLRIAFIRIDFLTDRSGNQTTGNGHFDLSGPDTTLPPIDRAPHNRTFYLQHLEAMNRYYDAQSYGRVVIVGDVWPRSENAAYSASDMADFGPWKFSRTIYRQAVDMFRAMMFAADTQSVQAGDPIPWDSYDRFMVIHAGSDFQSDLRGDSPLDIPSFTVGLGDTDVVLFAPDSTNRPIDRAAFIPETANQDGFYGALNGVIAHENGHNIFGFADLYDVESGLPVVGLWSLMDSGNLAGSQVGLPNGDVIFATGLLPPALDPFQRFFTTDALHFVEPAFGETTSVQNGERFADMRRIFLTSDEYLILENRDIAPGDVVELDQDSTTRVVLGPKSPDRYEYDALVPGPGMLIWHVDASVIPFETALRANPDWNTIPGRLGISVVEADGLGDLGDPGSPYILGSPLDPYFRFKSNNAVLDDSTIPPLRTHIGARPHMRIEVLDEPGPTMRFAARRSWLLDGWPAAADFPPGGPLLMAIDADGDRDLEVCWAGGADGSPDSSALFAVRKNGRGINDSTAAFARLNRRPRPLMAALPTQDLGVPGQAGQGPSYFAVTTFADGPDTSFAGGRVFLLDYHGNAFPGWPPLLPSIVTTPPVIAGGYPNASVYVGAADGRVYAIELDGSVKVSSGVALAGGVVGRLAVDASPPGVAGRLIAAGGATGQVAVYLDAPAQPLSPLGGWPVSLVGAGFDPEFLWMDFDGRGAPAGGAATCPSGRTLIVHHADRLWAFCANGGTLAGWGGRGDTLATGLGAGDPDGDGYAEVLAQSIASGVGFWNQTGRPSPGWPRRATREGFRTESPPLAVDVNGDARTDVVAMNASGILAALDGYGQVPEGWPLATGAGAIGSPVAADLDRNGRLEIVAPDRSVPDSLRSDVASRFGTLYAYTLPAAAVLVPGQTPATVWTMLGGDPGRTATLADGVSPTAGAPVAGPYVRGSLKAYPNPARNQPVSLAYQLSEPADVEIRIFDASGHEVTSFSRAGRRADNLEVWDPGSAPAGLYLARLRFRGAAADHTETVLVGVLR